MCITMTHDKRHKLTRILSIKYALLPTDEVITISWQYTSKISSETLRGSRGSNDARIASLASSSRASSKRSIDFARDGMIHYWYQAPLSRRDR